MGFSSEELNAARQRLLDRVVEYFLAKKGVEALYIQGFAAGSTDEFSDIDFRVVIQPEVYEQYILERFFAPQHWGEWVISDRRAETFRHLWSLVRCWQCFWYVTDVKI